MVVTRFDEKDLRREARLAVRSTGQDLYGTRRARLDGWHIEFRPGMSYMVLVAKGSVKVAGAARTDFTANVAI